MGSFFHVIVVAVVCAALGAAGWFVTPRGKNQTLIRSSLLLTLTCCYLMWAITYLAQLHPLIALAEKQIAQADRTAPRRSDLRWEN